MSKFWVAAHDPIPLPEHRFVRYTFVERLIHWFAGFTYLYLLMSGLAFYTPYLYWLAIVLGGGPTARFWHPWVGLVFVVALALMHSLWRGDMKMTEEDRRWAREMKHYVKNEDELMPAVDRFNAGQKQFYWVMFVGVILLTISGIVMWVPEAFPSRMNWVRQTAILVHEVAALLTIGAFIVHVYMGLLVVPGGLKGMVHGDVPERWARTHHRLWLRRAKEKSAPQE